MLETLLERFELENDQLATVGPAEVLNFLPKTTVGQEVLGTLAYELSKTALELSWMRWPERLERSVGSILPDIALNLFKEVPRAADFFGILNAVQANADQYAAMTESEYRLRIAYGDNLLPRHFDLQQDSSFQPVKNVRTRRVTGDFRSELDESLPLRGVSLFGRQRSFDPDDLRCTDTPNGQRIIIARRNDVQVSREHLLVQLLSPDVGLVQNQSEINKIAIAPNDCIEPGELRLVQFPFVAILSNQQLRFD